VVSPSFHYVETAYAHGAISGYDDHTFRPYNTITRAQLSKMIVLAKGWTPLTPPVPSFSDVPNTHWAYSFIETIHAQNLVSGYADGTFHPGSDATRAQLSKMLSTAFHLPNGSGNTPTPVAGATGTVTPTPISGTTTATPVADTATATPLTRR
jgi:S-layer homology domain